MNDKKFAFIQCSNNEMLLEESRCYLSRLIIPEGYEVEVITITEAKYMSSAYNEAIACCDAKYKIYMHQDVFIVNRNFLSDILTIFNSDEKIGMIGMIGYPTVSPCGIMWTEKRYGAVPMYGVAKCRYKQMDFSGYSYNVKKELNDCAIIDGLCMITQYDIPWDEDFSAWDFYDASHSIDMLEAGYRVVVPTQTIPWFIHDDGGILSLFHYNESRKLFMKKHVKYIGKSFDKILRQEG